MARGPGGGSADSGDRTAVDPLRGGLAGAAADRTRLDPDRDRLGPRPPEPAARRGDPQWGDDELPRALARRFRLTRRLTRRLGDSADGATADGATADGATADGPATEADLFVVVPRLAAAGAAERVVKLYHPGRVPDAEVFHALAAPPPPGRHLVEVSETGTELGRFYEIQELVEGSDLGELLASHPGGLPFAVVRAIVEQAAEALAELHARGVAHRDVKPANLLLRGGLPPDPADIDVVLLDLGISARVGPGTARLGPVTGTVRYQAPEAVAGWQQTLRTAVSDWWSLGATVLALATGRRPYERVPVPELASTIAQRPPDWSEITDDQLTLLVRGLLTHNSEYRWGAEDIHGWLAGDSPAVYDYATDRATEQATGPGDGPGADGPGADGAAGTQPPSGPGAGPSVVPYLFGTTSCTSPVELAIALARQWEPAAYSLFGPGGDDERVRLRGWLAQFDDTGAPLAPAGPTAPTSPGGARWRALLQAADDSPEPPDVRLLRLLRGLDPTLPPIYRGQQIMLSTLPSIALQAIDRDPRNAALIIADLWDYRLLPALRGGRDSDGLTETQARWTALRDRWEALAADLRSRVPRVGPTLDQAGSSIGVSVQLLWSAIAPDAADRARRLAITPTALLVSRAGDSAAWYRELARRASDPVHGLAAFLLAREARAEIREDVDGQLRRAAELAAVDRDEWLRADQRPIALVWGAAAIALIVTGWVIVLTTADLVPFANRATIAAAWLGAGISLLTMTLVEGAVALDIGGAYHRGGYSLITAMIRRGAWVADWLRRSATPPGGEAGENVYRYGFRVLAAVLGALAAALLVTLFAPYLLPVASLVLFGLSVRRRRQNWRTDLRERDARLERARRERAGRRRAAAAGAGDGAPLPGG